MLILLVVRLYQLSWSWFSWPARAMWWRKVKHCTEWPSVLIQHSVQLRHTQVTGKPLTGPIIHIHLFNNQGNSMIYVKSSSAPKSHKHPLLYHTYVIPVLQVYPFRNVVWCFLNSSLLTASSFDLACKILGHEH